MSSTNESQNSARIRFPIEGVFPSVAEFQEYLTRSLDELGLSAYALAKRIPSNTNDNLVRNIQTGAASNPTHRVMKQIFDAIENERQSNHSKPMAAE